KFLGINIIDVDHCWCAVREVLRNGRIMLSSMSVVSVHQKGIGAMNETEKFIERTLRCPDTLQQLLRESARHNFRSVNAEICARLSLSFQNEQPLSESR